MLSTITLFALFRIFSVEMRCGKGIRVGEARWCRKTIHHAANRLFNKGGGEIVKLLITSRKQAWKDLPVSKKRQRTVMVNESEEDTLHPTVACECYCRAAE